MKQLRLMMAMFVAMIVGQVSAQVVLETDLTSRFGLEPTNWTGASGWCASQYGPTVTTNDGRSTLLAENYKGNAAGTGDLIYQTLTGLANGTYRVELYAAAASTHERDGFATDVQEGDTDAAVAFAEAGGDRKEVALTAHVATSFSEVNTCVIDNVVVTDGTVKIGLAKLAEKTNWHIIQIKGVTATVNADDALAASIALAEGVNTEMVPAVIAEELKRIIDTYKGQVYETAEDYLAAIKAVEDMVAKANIYVAATPKLQNINKLIQSTNVYTKEAYDAYFAVYTELKDAYEAGTLTLDAVNAAQDPYAGTGWHADLNFDDFLLSAWTIGGEQAQDFSKALYINTWSVEGNTDGSDFKVPFFEYWTGDGASLGANDIVGTVSGLAPGKYQVCILARVRYKNGAELPAYGITMQLNDGQPVSIAAGKAVENTQFYLGTFIANGEVGEDGELKVIINVAEDNNISWLSFQNVNYAPYYESANLDFAEGTPVAVGVRTYEKDLVEGSGDVAQMQEVTGWNISENGDARAAGLFAYGSDAWLGGTDYVAPAINPAGAAEGNALGIVAVWTGKAQYTQPITLPAGHYKMTVKLTNVGGAGVPAKNLNGFVAEGIEAYAPAKAYAVGEWTEDVISFTLTEQTTGSLSLGYQSENVGSGTAPHLFIDNVTLETIDNRGALRTQLSDLVAQLTAAMQNAVVGDGLFMVKQELVDQAQAFIAQTQALIDNENATEEELTAAIEAATIAIAAAKTAVNMPDPEKTYAFNLKEGGKFLSLYADKDDEGNITASGVRLADEPYKLSFVSNEDGTYYLTDGELYVGIEGTNNWTMSAAPDKKAVLTFAPLPDGYYTIHTPKGDIGADSSVSGSACYSDKSIAKVGDRAEWGISEYNGQIDLLRIQLATLISEAKAFVENTPQGDGLFQIDAETVEGVNKLIAEMEACLNNPEVTEEDMQQMIVASAIALELAKAAANQPDPEKKYEIQLKDGGKYLSLYADKDDEGNVTASGVRLAEEAYPLSFVAGEDGTYFLTDGELYVGIAGTDNWTMTATEAQKAQLVFTALPDGFYTIRTEKGLIGVDNTNAGDACYANKAVSDKAEWAIAEFKNIIKFEITHERTVGQGYTATTATIDEATLEKVKEYLGVEELTTSMLRIENPDGELISDYAAYDGWFNAEGAAETWGDNTKVCVKFFEAIPNGTFSICDMNGADEVDAVYTVKWQLVNEDKAAQFTINVKFIALPDYKPEIVKVIEIDHAEKANTAYCEEEPAPRFNVFEVLDALGITDMADAKAYIVNVTTGNFVENTTDGWRDANGDACQWGAATNGFCLKLDDPASGEFNYTGAHDANFNDGDTYVALWGIVANEKAVLLRVNVTFASDPTGISNVNAIDLSNAQIFNLNGQKVNKAQKGIYIVNGKKVLVK